MLARAAHASIGVPMPVSNAVPIEALGLAA
jgi:hypothetical protein